MREMRKTSIPGELMQKTVRQADLLFIAALLMITIAGGLVRLQPAIVSPFPLNDGGLFYTMTMDLKNNGFVLPQTTTYNTADIPFAYPPLTFYLAGLLSTLTGWQVLDIIRVLPALISTLTIPAFFLLAREVTGRNMPATLGTLTFAMLPRTFDWLIMGGGITRSFGMLFAILAVWQGSKFISNHQLKNLLFFAILSGLVVYSHPEATVHVAIGMAVFYLVCDRSRKGLIFLAIAGAAIAILAAPWWAVILQRHGTDPFLAASAAARQDSYDPLVGLVVLFRYHFTDEPFTTIFASIGLLGLFRLLAQRKFLVPAWFFMAHLLEPRGGTLYMMIPLSIAAGIALDEIILPGFDPEAAKPNRPAIVTSVFLVLLFFYGTFSANFASSKILAETTLNPADLAAFDWVRENTAQDGRFVILSGENALRDPTSEWFPSITLRQSQATIFGYEWFNDGNFAQRKQRYTLLQECAFQDVECIEQWRLNTPAPAFNYVYIRKMRVNTIMQTPLDISLRQSAGYRIVYENMQVNIFERLAGQ
jgi:hypothetical protein